MKILIISDSLVTGGAETFALRLARALLRRGHACDVLNLNPDFEDERLVRQFADVPILRVPMRGLRTLKRLDRLGQALGIDLGLQRRHAVRWIGRTLPTYEIYHSHLFAADEVAADVISGNATAGAVSTQHGDYEKYLSGFRGSETLRIPGFAERVGRLEGKMSRFVTISERQTRLLHNELGLDAAKLVKILNGYEPPSPISTSPRRDHRLCFAMAARGIEEKGWRFLVDAFRTLDTDARLLLIGEGPELQRLRDEAGNDRRIEFAGFQPNPAQLVRHADLFIHPSVHPTESLPTAIVEALFCGVPVLATDVGEVAAMLRTPSGDRAGTLVRADRATLAADLHTELKRYATNSDLLALHASRTSDAFAKFSMDQCAERYVELFERVAREATASIQRSPQVSAVKS